MLALAEPECLLFLDLDFHRLEAGAFVRAVAKWRMTGAPAGAPPMDPGIHLQCKRFGVANDRVSSHEDEFAGRRVLARYGSRQLGEIFWRFLHEKLGILVQRCGGRTPF